MGLDQVISHNLRAIRHSKGLSQRELADITGFDEKFISQLENKPRHISTKTLERLAEGLGVAEGDLIKQSKGQVGRKGFDSLPARFGPGLDEAIKTLKMLRSRVRD